MKSTCCEFFIVFILSRHATQMHSFISNVIYSNVCHYQIYYLFFLRCLFVIVLICDFIILHEFTFSLFGVGEVAEIPLGDSWMKADALRITGDLMNTQCMNSNRQSREIRTIRTIGQSTDSKEANKLFSIFFLRCNTNRCSLRRNNHDATVQSAPADRWVLVHRCGGGDSQNEHSK